MSNNDSLEVGAAYDEVVSAGAYAPPKRKRRDMRVLFIRHCHRHKVYKLGDLANADGNAMLSDAKASVECKFCLFKVCEHFDKSVGVNNL